MDSRRALVFVFASLALGGLGARGADFRSDWMRRHDRVWIGEQYWANPMEDWRLRDGLLECTRTGPNRNVQLLTHQLGDQPGEFQLSVQIGLQDAKQGQGSAGFAIGIRSELGDYRSSLIHGTAAIEAGATINGLMFLGPPGEHETLQADLNFASAGVVLSLKGKPGAEGEYELTLVAMDPQTQAVRGGPLTAKIKSPGGLAGNVALVNNFAAVQGRRQRAAAGYGTAALFWFDDWKVSGPKVVEHPDQTFGPILYSMYTLSRGVMKMTAQMPPVGTADSQTVLLQVRQPVAEQLLNVPEVTAGTDGAANGDWITIARANIDPLSRTAHFRVPQWPDTEDVPYQLYYVRSNVDGQPEPPATHEGVIRKDPIDKETISVAGFTGNTDPAFPNALLASNVKKHNPDLLFFSGDQIYENVGGYGIIREPVPDAVLNYLRKISLWGWAFRDVLKDRPSLVLPDDHDVYQGNIWGAGGKYLAGGIDEHDAGGFAQHADFVNAVFRTQAGHHPDPFDARPMLQGIDCWYGDMLYGRISFAVIEDRYFKDGPKGKVNNWPGRPDHQKDPKYDAKKLDKPGLALLGDRQIRFLDAWAADWRGADMKCCVSQTIFCNLANYHGGNQEFIFADLDSNGWPQTGRNEALDSLRRGFAFMYAGDQHLPSIVHHGIDEFGDAGWSFCVPSTAAGYPRSWRPDAEGRPVQNRPDPNLPNTGEYLDGFGNRMTVYAIGNPEAMNRRPVLELLHDKASGYGLVHFHKPDRTITIECFKLLFDAADAKPGDQFPGWPRTISMYDNYGRKAAAYLPTIKVEGMTDPVVQVIDEKDGSIIYTVRIAGTSFRPKVFAEGTYTVRVGEPEGRIETRNGIDTRRAVDTPLTFRFD